MYILGNLTYPLWKFACNLYTVCNYMHAALLKWLQNNSTTLHTICMHTYTVQFSSKRLASSFPIVLQTCNLLPYDSNCMLFFYSYIAHMHFVLIQQQCIVLFFIMYCMLALCFHKLAILRGCFAHKLHICSMLSFYVHVIYSKKIAN